jgi:exodeoxyribonuclease VII small subunit
MQLWERGEALADKCEQWLSGARETLQKAAKAKKSSAE